MATELILSPGVEPPEVEAPRCEWCGRLMEQFTTFKGVPIYGHTVVDCEGRSCNDALTKPEAG